MSTDGIGAGDMWTDVVSGILERTDFGIICVTRDNPRAPWLLFEAGALAKRRQQGGRIVPFLVDGALPEGSPLAIYQGKVADRAGTRDLVDALWDACGCWVDRNDLREQLFAQRWPQLETELRKIAGSPEQARKVSDEVARPSWETAVPVPGPADFERLRPVRHAIRERAADSLRTALGGNPDEVRVNVFLVDADQVPAGIIELRMVEGLMPRTAIGEPAVFFRQNQGLTGNVFQHGCPLAAWGASRPGGDDWQLIDFGKGLEYLHDAALNIGARRNEALEPRMRWLLSLPLRTGESPPLGVLNIDGFAVLPRDRAQTEAIFASIAEAVRPELDNFVDLLEKCRCLRLRLRLE
jgi:hypothetical protein